MFLHFSTFCAIIKRMCCRSYSVMYSVNMFINVFKAREFITCQSLRSISTGVNEWNSDITSLIKHKIEQHWRDKVGTSGFDEESKRPKYYVLSMFPYPSGRLHMGHVRVYTISDTMARFYRMNGKNVIHPIGWDAFGLPAENAAMERGIEPGAWTRQNIEQMRAQLQALGCSFDWDRQVTTCDPDYYCWTQYIFLKLHEAGLVYRKEALVNWDPVDKTVLADEQVDANSCSWRSGAKVEKKLLNQWFIRTTRFSESLLDGLDDPILQDWRDITKLQKHWIGECNGTHIEFQLENEVGRKAAGHESLSVWTPNPEFIHKVSFIAVAPNSVLDKSSVTSSISSGPRKLPYRACNPFTGERIPVFVSDQVEYNLGTDCHLGIPDISDSDRSFAESVNIPLSQSPEEGSGKISSENEKILRERVCKAARQQGIGGYPTSSKLRDWLISRQRYWGTPIPMVYCDACNGPQPVPYSQLPITLPVVDKLSNRGQSPLLDNTEWLHTKCPTCGGNARRETDTMDTFVDSSWYFLRYLDPHNAESPFGKDKTQLMPVDLYIGGKEHAVLHLYYARFMNHFLHSYGLVAHREPFRRLLVQGMVMGKSYRVRGTGRYVAKDQVDFDKPKKLVEKATGEAIITAWEKMSKSKYNGVDPEEMLKEFGSDTTRLLILADVAPTSHRNWTSDTFPGILKWQHRLWLTLRHFINIRKHLDLSVDVISEELQEAERNFHDNRNYYLKGATFNYSSTYQLSVAISKMQGLTNSLRRASPLAVGRSRHFERALALQIIMLAPMAPHFASELWAGFLSAPQRINTDSEEILWDRGVLEQAWPQVDPDYQLELVCKVNGHEHCCVHVPRQQLDRLTHDDALEMALLQPLMQQHTSGRKIVDTFFTHRPSHEACIDVITETDSIKQQAGS